MVIWHFFLDSLNGQTGNTAHPWKSNNQAGNLAIITKFVEPGKRAFSRFSAKFVEKEQAVDEGFHLRIVSKINVDLFQIQSKAQGCQKVGNPNKVQTVS
jgi:hypothetical protein